MRGDVTTTSLRKVLHGMESDMEMTPTSRKELTTIRANVVPAFAEFLKSKSTGILWRELCCE